MPETALERKVIFDIHCETSNGERIIIEMQNREQPYFKDRTLYYLARSVVDQGIKGVWDYKLAAVYGVFFLNFTLEEGKGTGNRGNSEETSSWRPGDQGGIQPQVPPDLYRASPIQERGGRM